MIHLSKSPKTGKYHVAVLARNRNILTSTESNGLATKKGAMKNIRAQMLNFHATSVLVQDNTGKVPVILNVTRYTASVAVASRGNKLPKPGKPYIPGRKPKKK